MALTTMLSSHHAQLAGSVDNASPLWSAIRVVRWQRILLNHCLQLRPTAEEASTVIDVVDGIKFRERGVDRVHAAPNDTRIVDAIVESPEFVKHRGHKRVHERLGCNVPRDRQDLGTAVVFDKLASDVLQCFGVSICDCYSRATSFCKSFGDSGANA